MGMKTAGLPGIVEIYSVTNTFLSTYYLPGTVLRAVVYFIQ